MALASGVAIHEVHCSEWLFLICYTKRPESQIQLFFFFYRFFSLNSLDFTAKDKVCIAALAVSSL